MGDFTNFTIVVANYFTILASNYFTQPLLQKPLFLRPVVRQWRSKWSGNSGGGGGVASPSQAGGGVSG